jgi:hypothetical protein
MHEPAFWPVVAFQAFDNAVRTQGLLTAGAAPVRHPGGMVAAECFHDTYRNDFLDIIACFAF